MNIIDLELHLPWPPTVNHYYSHTRNGIYISKKGTQYRKAIAESCFEQIGRKLKLNKKLMIICILYPPDRRIRDLDNYKKSFLDALTKAELWEDDSLIDQDFSFRGSVISKGKIVLYIRDAGIIIPESQPSIVHKIIGY